MEHKFSEQFLADVAKLVEAYKSGGKRYMLAHFRDIVEGSQMKYWEAAAMIDQVWYTLAPGATKEARIARMKLIKAA